MTTALQTKYWRKRQAGTINAIHPMTGAAIYVNPQRDCLISEDLDQEWTRYPALVAWYRSLRDVLKADVKRRQQEEQLAMDMAYMTHKQKGGKATETEMKVIMRTAAGIADLAAARTEAENSLQRLDSALSALEEKRWSLLNKTKLRLAERQLKDSF